MYLVERSCFCECVVYNEHLAGTIGEVIVLI